MNDFIEIVAWPVVVIVLALIFREPLTDLIRAIAKFKYKGIEIDFGRSLEKIKERIPDSHRESLSTSEPPKAEVNLMELAKVSPAAAVLESWKSVGQSATNLLTNRGIELDDKTRTPYKLIQYKLVGENIVDQKWIQIFDSLRNLRNKVAHARGFEITESQAHEYVRLANRMKNHLDQKA